MNGGAQVAEVLKQQGVSHLFTLCGGHISPILVEAKRRNIQIIDVRAEENAAFCADAFSRLSGTVGVAAVTAGPGVTNTITAIKNAQMAQSPLVLIGGATATLLRGRGSLQDIDQMSLMRPHVKWMGRPNRVCELVPTLETAFRIAQEGVPGPVFVELAVDLLYEESVVREWTAAKTEKANPTITERALASYIKLHLWRVFGGTPSSPKAKISPSPAVASTGLLKKAARALNDAQKPLMVIGSQALLNPSAQQELIAAIEALSIPVFLSGMARGLLGKDHPLQLRHKRRLALREADVVMLLGVPCDFRLDYGSHVRRAKVISINRSLEDLNKNRRPNIGLLADPHQCVIELAKLAPRSQPPPWLESLRARHNQRETEISEMAELKAEGINPISFFKTLDEFLSPNSILVGDGGDFVATAAYVLQPRRPYSWLDPGVFGTLGVGAGFAISAQLHKPEAETWLIYGDGAAGFSLMELDTCVRHKIPIIAVVGNDGCWTQIARDQVVILEDDVGTTLTRMDYHVVAEGCGAHGICVTEESEVQAALEEARAVAATGKPVLINLHIGSTDFRKGSISM